MNRSSRSSQFLSYVDKLAYRVTSRSQISSSSSSLSSSSSSSPSLLDFFFQWRLLRSPLGFRLGLWSIIFLALAGAARSSLQWFWPEQPATVTFWPEQPMVPAKEHVRNTAKSIGAKRRRGTGIRKLLRRGQIVLSLGASLTTAMLLRRGHGEDKGTFDMIALRNFRFVLSASSP